MENIFIMKHRKRIFIFFFLFAFIIEQENVAINLQRLTNQFQSLKKHQQLESLISIILLFN